MNSLLLPGSIVALSFSFFFTGMETAYRHVHAAPSAGGKYPDIAHKIVSFFTQRPMWFVGTTRVGNTLALASFSFCLALWMAPFFGAQFGPQYMALQVVLQTIITTALLAFTADILSHRIFRLSPERILYALAPLFGICFLLLSWLTFPLVALSRWVTTRVLRLPFDDLNPVFGSTDLHQYVKNIYHVNPEAEAIRVDRKIFYNALEFKSVKIRECMIPRTEITATEINESIETLREAFVESGHSKVIIYNQRIDDVVGYCHSSSLFKKPKNIRDILTPIIIVAETSLANELMIRFINERKSLAVVVDEFGGTSGIVSMEDVIEEIFGDIEDEHDEDTLVEQQLDDHTFLVSARLEIDYLNETYGWKLPVGEYETLGGFILALTEDFPQSGQTIAHPPYTFTIQSTLNNRIGTVKVALEKDDEND
ncbi:hemolysin family protein [Chryseolinea lacunae]|uniref:HlyC/CorC family transporter n=1 Tax=Chryseolinea lacunae TaxID=2801331 RepID=A0ABS1KSJ5_9BACT|nr:hemolysin family protein [Chryseolinea lacunae]MBL0742283.1 HlyC/CorC family transporter [Chryseolinea lacunae]